MIDVSEIKRLIEADNTSVKKRLARQGVDYYEGCHDILDYRLFYYNADGILVEDKTRANNRICHPFFSELVDQLVSYILSNEENPIRSDAEGLQERLDEYFDDDFWSEAADLLAGAYVKGFEYMYAYKNAEERLAFQCADSIGVVEVREHDTDDHCAYFIYWYVDRIEKGTKEIIRIQIHNENEIWFYVQDGSSGEITLDKDQPTNPRPNVIYTDTTTGQLYGDSLGFIPFFKLSYNNKEFSGLKPIKALIDDYDLMECGLSNNLQDFDTPIHVVKGFEGDNLDELQHNIKTKKVVGIDGEGGIDVLTVDVPYEARKTKADEDEKNIYRFGMGLNTQGLKDTNATTNLAIRASYSLLDLKAEKFEKRFKKFLKLIARPVLDEINAKNSTDYRVKDIYFDFKHNILLNETENIQNEKTKAETQQIQLNSVLSSAAYLGDDETLKAICDVFEINPEDIKVEPDAAAILDSVKGALNNIPDATDPEEQIEAEPSGDVI